MYSQRGIRSGKIYIDKAEYFVENRKYNSLISKKIDFYYISERGSDAPMLAAASVANDGNILCVRASGKNTFSDGKFTYERENGKTETITVGKGYDLILNNGAILTVTKALCFLRRVNWSSLIIMPMEYMKALLPAERKVLS